MQATQAPERDAAAPRVKVAARRSLDSRRVLAIVVGVVLAVAVAAVVTVGVLRGLSALVVSAVVALAVPTSREFSRRAFVAGCVLIGWVPLMWWWRLPVGRVGHAGLLLALLVGCLAGWVLWTRPLARLRSLVPKARWTDLVLAAGAGLAAWIYAPGLRSVSAESVLTRFLRGWDNSAHFDITETIRHYGVTINHAPVGPLGEWAYSAYPQGFHALAATVMELLIGPWSPEPGTELSGYAQALTVVVVLAIATVLAGLCSLPAMRRRPLLALPTAVLVVATFGLGPGGMLLHNGFPNFYVAVAALCCLPIAALQMAKPGAFVPLVALAGAALGVAHNWSLLLTMGAFAVLAIGLPWRRARWPRARAEWWRVGVVVGLAAFGMAAAWSMLRHQIPLGQLINVGGGISPVPANQVLLAAAAAVGLCAVGINRARRSTPHADEASRLVWVGLVPAAGAVGAALIAASQIRTGGDIGYYFWKYAIALQIVSVVVACCALPLVLPVPGTRMTSRWWRRTGAVGLAAVASLVATLAAVQTYGLPHRFPTSIGGGVAPGIEARADYAALSLAASPEAVMVIAAARADDGAEVPHVFAIARPDDKVSQVVLAQWYNALTGRWTSETDRSLLDFKMPRTGSPADVASTVRGVLRVEPDARVVVDPEVADEVRVLVGAEHADRVMTW